MKSRRRHCLLLVVLLFSDLSFQLGAETLGVAEELTVSAGWSEPVLLELAEEGRYRLEATTLSGDPVEVVVERQNAGGAWTAAASNRTLKGNAQAFLDLSIQKGEQWRVVPAGPRPPTVVLRLLRTSFTSLRETLKQGLTSNPGAVSPLTLRVVLPPGSTGQTVAAATGPRGELWVGWIDTTGAVVVWDATVQRLVGRALVPQGAAWTQLSLSGSGGLRIQMTGPGGVESRVWTGADWADEASSDSLQALRTGFGVFRAQIGSTAQVFKTSTTGWVDLELPQEEAADQVRLGSTEDGLYVFLASSHSPYRALYLWRPSRSWLALPPPVARGELNPSLWAVTTGAGSLFCVDGSVHSLALRQFDGTQWSAPLDLTSLAPTGARAVCLLPASAWSKTGTLVVASDRIRVYDLP